MINQYSFVIIGLIVLIGIIALCWRIFGFKYVIPLALLISISWVSIQLFLSSNMAREVGNEYFDGNSEYNKPALLVMYSNYWIACLAAKPSVDRLESNLNGEVLLLRIDVLSRLGKPIWTKYGNAMVPTFIAIDKDGNEAWRQSGTVPDLNKVLSIDS